jgi:hypothetical protein
MQGEETELRVFSNGQYYGRFMMTPEPKLVVRGRIELPTLRFSG